MLALRLAVLPQCLPARRFPAAASRCAQSLHHKASTANPPARATSTKRPPLAKSKNKSKSPFKILEKLNSTRRDLRPSAISLLEELFPAETASSRASRAGKQDGAGAARPAQPVPWMPFDDALDASEHAKAQSVESGRRKAAARADEGVTLLVLRKASVHLCEADFRRVVPTGQHIEGWNRGAYSRIIKGRALATLRPNGTYYLEFPTLDAAQAYQRNAMYLHDFNKRFDLSKADAPIPPPPMLLDDGKRLEEPLTRFTLCLPSQELSLELVRQPFRPELRKIVEAGFMSRHDGAMAEEQAPHRVLVDFESDKAVPYFVVRGAIEKDGDGRNMQWALAGAQGGIRWINVPQAQRRAPLLRYVISFADESEARRFCMEWHRRDVAGLFGAVATGSTESWQDEGAIVANAEYIW